MCTVCIGHLHLLPFSGSLERLVIFQLCVLFFMVINNILSLISTAYAHGSWTTCLMGVSWKKKKDYSLSCQLPVANKGGVLGAPPQTVVEFAQACSGNHSHCQLMCATLRSHPEVSISQLSHVFWVLHSFCPSLKFSKPWEMGDWSRWRDHSWAFIILCTWHSD